MRILILGASSYIGSRLYKKLGAGKAIGTYNSHVLEHCIHFDALNMGIPDIIDGGDAFTHAVILLSNTKPDLCAKNKEGSSYLNVRCICKIIDELNSLKIIPVFISTEVVFDGKKGNYSENDETSPILTYGAQKVEVERYLQDNCRKFLIVRLAKVYGYGLDDGTLFTAWLKQMLNNEKIICAWDSIFSPIHVDDVNDGLIKLMEHNYNGIFHMANNNAYSRLEMLNILRKYYKKYRKTDSEVVECSIYDLPTVEKRPLNISLNNKKLIQATKLKVRDIDEACEYITRAAFGGG